MSRDHSKPFGDKTPPNWLELVQHQVGSLKFGVVQITVRDGRVVQVETTERLRFDKPSAEAT